MWFHVLEERQERRVLLYCLPYEPIATTYPKQQKQHHAFQT